MADSSLDSTADTAAAAADAAGAPVSLVTGGTGAIGTEVVRRLAARGDRVIVVGRDAERGATVAADATEGADGEARFVETDLASQAAVASLADRVSRTGRLDRIVAAHGTFSRERRVTDDGVEYTLAVNYLSTYRLVHDLLPVLVETAPDDYGGTVGAGDDPVRIVALTASVSDEPIALGDLGATAGDYSMDAAYATSKRCLTAFTVELADRLPGGIAADALHPGFVPDGRSKSELPWFVRGPMGLLSKLSVGDGPDVAADRVLDLATDASGATGRYVEGDDSVDVPDFAADPDARERLWERSADLAGVAPDWPRGAD